MNTANDSSGQISRQILSLLIAGFEGTILPGAIRKALDNGLGGIILFARNYQNKDQLKNLTDSIKSHNPKSIIAVDQEGGRVTRFAGDFPAFPPPGYFGARDDLQGLIHATSVTAANLRECGISCNLIPICDLQPSNRQHVVFNRAYSSHPLTCAEAVKAQIEILKQHQLLTSAKHFPGLMSATGDPHHVVSHSDRTREDFRNADYIPFAAAIKAGCDMVMPSHLMAPQLDRENIATFSEKIISGELREHLGFSGIVISDDLQMLGALQDSDHAGAGIKALSAGCELLIYGNLNSAIDSLIDELAGRVEEDSDLAAVISQRAESVAGFRQNASAILA